MKRLLIPIVLVSVIASIAAFAALDASASPGPAGGAAVKNLAGCGASSIPANDDGSSSLVPLPFSLNFFGTNYSSLYVNNNGNVTFDGPLITFTPFDLTSTSQVIIAAFFADVDTRGGGSGLTTYGSTTFSGRPAFCASWINVGYYDGHTDKLNSFQLLLVDRSDVGVGDFDIIMNYNQVQWETGDVSGGTNGLGGSSARAGYSNGVDTAFELPGSAVNGAFLDSSPTGLGNNSRNSTTPGRYVFSVRNGQAPTGGSISGTILGDPEGASGGAGVVGVPLAHAPVQLCPGAGGTCQFRESDDLGNYIFSPVPDGVYNGAAFPPANWDLFPGTRVEMVVSGGAALTDQDMFLGHPGPLPSGVTIQTIATTQSGAPVISWGVSVPFSIVNCAGGSNATWELIKDGVVIQSGTLTQSPAGTYNGKIQPLQPRHGAAVLRVTIDCPSGPDKNLDIDVYIDPSGTIRDTHGDPVAGATVTLYRSDTSVGPFEAVEDGSAVMSPSNRTNPDTTGADGVFHWDVIAGFYKVRAEKAGCHAPGNAGQAFIETSVKEIPPEVTGLVLTLECPGGPVPTPTFTPTSQGPPPTPTRTPTPQPVEGDADCNRNVNSIDVALILQLGAGLLNSVSCPTAADVNDDGQANSIDAALILQFIAGLLGSL